MIEQLLATELGGTAKLEFESSGLKCDIVAPLGSERVLAEFLAMTI
jgi:hypothetical protein